MHDLRFALRLIATHRWFSAAVVTTLALGIGVNTMVFTLVNAVLFKPVPVPGGERLVAIRNRSLTEASKFMSVSYPDFREYRAQSTAFTALEAAAPEAAILSEQGNPPQTFIMSAVTPGMFDMLRMRPVLGRAFLPADGVLGAEAVILLGHGVWKDRYAQAANVLGRQVRLNAKPAVIVGVMPEGFKFPSREEMWTVLQPTPAIDTRARRSLQLFGMLKPGTSIEQARSDLGSVAGRLAAEFPDTGKGVGAAVQTFHDRYNGGPVRAIFLLTLAAVAFVLLIACANVANMMLSRALARQREMSIRAAMGAARWQVVRLLMVESLVLSFAGGAAGLALAVAGVRAMNLATQDVGKPYWVQFTMDYAVFGYFAGICLLSALLFGLAPALRFSRVDLNSAVKDGTRSAGSRGGGRLSAALVVFQVALTLVLLSGAGAFLRTFFDSLNLNPSVPADRLLTARVRLAGERYADPGARVRFFEELSERAKALPGVTQLTALSNLPGNGAGARRIEIEGAPIAPDPSQGPSATEVVVSPGYFAAIDLPILQGRDFNANDGLPGRLAAIVTREFAQKHWPREQAGGKRFRFYARDKPAEWIAVVGVSADIVQRPNEHNPDPLVFLPYRQDPLDSVFLLVRAAGNPLASIAPLRAAVQSMDSDLPLFDVRTLTDVMARNNWFLRVFGNLFAVFAGIALAIAAVGIYAVMAEAAERRTREMGVRMALGATPSGILRLVLGRGAVQLAIGLALGFGAMVPTSRMLSQLPFKIAAVDGGVLAIVGLTLTAVGLLACWLPARRASSLDPVNAMRSE